MNQRAKTNPEDRFWTKVEKADGCWHWTAHRGPDGYGGFYDGESSKVWAHRFSYRIHKGEVPDGMVIDHLCRNRLCVNPDHLEAVSNKTNLLRGQGLAAKNARKTSCKRGHPFDGGNLLMDARGVRRCRTCKLGGQKVRRAKLP